MQKRAKGFMFGEERCNVSGPELEDPVETVFHICRQFSGRLNTVEGDRLAHGVDHNPTVGALVQMGF
jgi:hypothetical protein